MKRFRKGLMARALSWVLIVAMAIPGVVSLTPVPAAAQQPARGTVAVVDFQVRPGMQQALLSRAATDAVALELSRAGFNVVARSQVQDALQELGLEPILDRLGVLKLGTTLGVDSIVSGEVVAVSVEGTPRTARVTLLVRVTDVASGEDVNGAAVTGRSNPRVGFVGEDDQLIREAISNAALEAVRTIAAYTIPEATVLNTLGEDEVVLNRGSRHGLKAGMEMIVLRGKEVVGRIRVTRPSASESTAKIITSTLGIQPEDRARAVFKLPTVQVVGGKVKMAEPRAKPKSAGLSNLGKFLVVVGLIFGALQVGKGGNPGVDGNPKAEACIYQGVPAVKISWKHSQFAQANNDRVLYQIYRDPGDPTRPRVPVLTAERNITEAYDTNIPRTVNYVQIDPGQEVDTPDLQEEEDVPGVTPGQSYRYSITLIYRFVSPFIGQPGGGQQNQQDVTYRESDKTFTGQATPLTPPQLLQPANGREDVDLTAVTFEFQAVPGAQAYRVEVSTDPTFTDKSRSFYTDEVSFPSGGTVVIRNVNLSGKFLPEQRLFWRAGARNVGDSPGPLPDRAGYRYIWSTEPFSFTAPVTPPPPPGS